MNSAAAQVPPQRLPPATGGGDGERDRLASRLLRLLSWKTLVIGACVVFTIYIAVVPLGFLLWQSFRTPLNHFFKQCITIFLFTICFLLSD